MAEEINTKKPTREKLTDEQRKARQKEHAKNWYLKKKAAEAKGDGKKKVPKNKKKPKQGDIYYLYWMNKKDEMFQEVDVNYAEQEAQAILMGNLAIQEVYLMEPTKLYNRGTIQVTDLL